MAYEIHSRRHKFLLMLQALKRLHNLEPENGELHRMLVDFVLAGQHCIHALLEVIACGVLTEMLLVCGCWWQVMLNSFTELNLSLLTLHLSIADVTNTT